MSYRTTPQNPVQMQSISSSQEGSTQWSLWLFGSLVSMGLDIWCLWLSGVLALWVFGVSSVSGYSASWLSGSLGLRHIWFCSPAYLMPFSSSSRLVSGSPGASDVSGSPRLSGVFGFPLLCVFGSPAYLMSLALRVSGSCLWLWRINACLGFSLV